MADIYLSLIIPSYNESRRIKKSLGTIYEYLRSQKYSYEVILCDDGSNDSTLCIAKDFSQGKSNFQILSLPHKGKGAAIKAGMIEARGKYRFMCDADLAMPVEQIKLFLTELRKGCDIAIGSRELLDSQRYEEPKFRYFSGRIFNLFVKLVALRKYRDTQCGFKCFSSEAAEKIFPLLKTDGWAFDVEALLLAERHGFLVSEIPIIWYHGGESKVKFRSAVFQMAKDILFMRIRSLFSTHN
ncbi:glycosyltransferase family 2 protein [Chloroflexi bacterium]|nr:glycosyltransferase family 2 protein [Chloroflexota bacterium]